MYEKILQKLKSQRGSNNQVSDKTLEVKAKTLETLITTDEILETIDFTSEIESMQGNIGHIASEAVKNIKPAEEKKEEKKEVKETTDPVIAQLLEQNKLIMEQLQGINIEKATQQRQTLLLEKIKDTPLIFKQATEKAFKRMSFATDEDFNEFLTETEASAKEAIQTGLESGLKFSTPPRDVNKPDPDGVTPEMQKAIKDITDKKEVTQKF